jgi:uncharacterized oligopeptide transporter (OPT) family protein
MAAAADPLESGRPNVPVSGASVRAIVTGMVIGALLTPCNVYSGLKIGWSFNMSITAALLSFAFWRLAEDLAGARAWHLQENVVNQTAASSAASIVSGGLVAPIPALTILTGVQLSLPLLCLWVFSVSALGIVVAVVLRNPMLVRDRLVFPAGVATAETVREIHGHGREAAARVRMLVAAALVAGGLKLAVDASSGTARWSPPLAWPSGGALREAGVGSIGLKQLGFSLDPSLLMVGFGAIIGLRAGLSLLGGAIASWLLLAPWVLAQGWAQPGPPQDAWFGPLVEWLLWPGVTLMTVASLSAFLQAAWRRRGASGEARAPGEPLVVGPRIFAAGAFAAGLLAVIVQQILFDVPPLLGLFAVLLAFVLAVVAARVVGETGIPPIGAIGKIAQLGFGVASPANQTINLMGANVTGGAAGQCADLLNDLRTGQMLGTAPAGQVLAQCFGVLIGSLVGSLVYLLLIPDPRSMLLTAEWPAPAVATWKAVAEVLSAGLHAIPPGCTTAMAVAAAVALAISILERRLPARLARWLPSGPALGLAFVIPAWISLSMALGAVAAAGAARLAPGWAARFVLALAAGLVAGESLAGIASAMAAFAWK